jgi:hypothetical protein
MAISTSASSRILRQRFSCDRRSFRLKATSRRYRSLVKTREVGLGAWAEVPVRPRPVHWFIRDTGRRSRHPDATIAGYPERPDLARSCPYARRYVCRPAAEAVWGISVESRMGAVTWAKRQRPVSASDLFRRSVLTRARPEDLRRCPLRLRLGRIHCVHDETHLFFSRSSRSIRISSDTSLA